MKKNSSFHIIVLFSILINIADSLIWPIISVYMHDYLSISLTLSGFVLFIMSSFILLGNYLGGLLFDFWSPYKAMILSISISLLSLIILIFKNDWPIFPIVICLYGLGQGSILTLINSYATKIKSINKRYIFDNIYIGMSIGCLIGTICVSFIFKFGISFIFLFSSIFYLILLFIYIKYLNIKLGTPEIKKENIIPKKSINKKLIYLILIMVLISNMIYVQWESIMPIYMEKFKISFKQYSLIWPLNSILIISFQTIIGKINSKFKTINIILYGTLIFSITFFLLILANSYNSFIIIMVILTIGEIIGFPLIPLYLNDLSNGINSGKYQGLYNIFISLGRSFGPLLAGFIIDNYNYKLLFIFDGISLVTIVLIIFISINFKPKNIL